MLIDDIISYIKDMGKDWYEIAYKIPLGDPDTHPSKLFDYDIFNSINDKQKSVRLYFEI